MSSGSSDAPAVKKEGENPYRKWPWGPAAAVIMTMVSFVASQLLVGGVFGIGLSLAGWEAVRVEDWFGSTLGRFVLVVSSEALTLAILAWFIRNRKAAWRMVGYQRGLRAKDVGLALLGFVIYFTLLIIVSMLAHAILGVDTDQKQELGFDNIFGLDEKILAFISLVLLPPIVEETIFRGFLYTGLRKKLTFVWATFFTSLLFAGPHLMASSTGPLWIAGIDTFVMSLVLCYLREKTGALYAPIIIHFIKNGIAFSVLYIFVS